MEKRNKTICNRCHLQVYYSSDMQPPLYCKKCENAIQLGVIKNPIKVPNQIYVENNNLDIEFKKSDITPLILTDQDEEPLNKKKLKKKFPYKDQQKSQ
jgi:hypothetical protein